MIIRF